MVDKLLGDDLGHELVGVVDALAALEAQGQGERICEIARVHWRQLVGGTCHGFTIAQMQEHNKNDRVTGSYRGETGIS